MSYSHARPSQAVARLARLSRQASRYAQRRAGVGLGGVRVIPGISLFVDSVGVEEPEWWECGRRIALLVEDERVGQHAAWSDRDVHAFR